MERSKSEVLRYLGYSGQPMTPELEQLVDACMQECRKAAKPHFTWQAFATTRTGDSITLANTGLALTGADIYSHLHRTRETAVLAATLGVGVDSLIRRYELADMTRSVILDACATQLIEEVCDSAEAEVVAYAKEKGCTTNFRYSPGYGDLGLDIQPAILDTLKTGKTIGLTCTDSLILLPRKSVTAFIGILPPGETAAPKGGCATCRLRESCNFRKGSGHKGCPHNNPV